MTNAKFFDLVKKNFSYLESDFNFNRVITDDSSPLPAVTYESSLCKVHIQNERGGQVVVDVKPSKELMPSVDLSEVILTRNPKSKFEYAMDLKDAEMTGEISRLSAELRNHCESILKGDFTEWDKFLALRKQRNAKYFGSKKNAQV